VCSVDQCAAMRQISLHDVVLCGEVLLTCQGAAPPRRRGHASLVALNIERLRQARAYAGFADFGAAASHFSNRATRFREFVRARARPAMSRRAGTRPRGCPLDYASQLSIELIANSRIGAKRPKEIA
jgi:hypothetical protein